MKMITVLLLTVLSFHPRPVSDCPCAIESTQTENSTASGERFPGAPAHVAEFFDQYMPLAVNLSMQFRVPASVILSVAALESGYGRADSRVIQECFNYFNIKTWGESDPICCKPDEYPSAIFCFRKYECPDESFRDFCRLMHTDNYRAITNLPRWDYRTWATQLHEAGYATDPAYAEKLILIIEKYCLNRFDPMPVPHPYCSEEGDRLIKRID